MSVKLSNSALTADEDEIQPPLNNLAPVPDAFPNTTLQLRNLVAGQLLTDIENYYGLSHNGNISLRKRRVFHAYGLRL